jgi:hypothetical protein
VQTSVAVSPATQSCRQQCPHSRSQHRVPSLDAHGSLLDRGGMGGGCLGCRRGGGKRAAATKIRDNQRQRTHHPARFLPPPLFVHSALRLLLYPRRSPPPHTVLRWHTALHTHGATPDHRPAQMRLRRPPPRAQTPSPQRGSGRPVLHASRNRTPRAGGGRLPQRGAPGVPLAACAQRRATACPSAPTWGVPCHGRPPAAGYAQTACAPRAS